MEQQPELALFDGLTDLYPQSALSETHFPPLQDQVLVTGEVPSAAGSAAGTDASSLSSHSSPSSPEIRLGQPAPIDELLTLIDWKTTGRSAPKRIRGDPQNSHEKHVQHEKQRRNELAQAIEDISSLIPQTPSPVGNKRTKLAALQEAAEYFKRVQDMALVLLEENKRLSASMQNSPALQPAMHHARSTLQGQELVRLFITTAFVVWIFVGVPTPWTGTALTSVNFGTRRVLSAGVETPNALVYVLHSLLTITAKVSVLAVVFVVMWIITLLVEMPKVTTEQLRAAEAHFHAAEVAVERNSNWVLAQKRHMEGMASLQKPYPESALGEAMFLLLHVIRAVLNLAYVGLWLERLLVYCTGRQEVTIVEARAYMLGFRIGPQHCPGLSYSFARCYGSIIASAAGYRVGEAPAHLQDELGSWLYLFLADIPHASTRLQQALASGLVWLVEAQLNPVSLNPAPSDMHEWTTLRMVGSPVHQSNLEEAYDVVMRLVPALKGCTQVKAISVAGTISFCLGRYRDAFLMMQTAVSTATKHGMMPIVAVRMMTGTIIISLWKLGQEKEARELLAKYEQLYICIPDGRSNILAVERSFLYISKVICAGDDFNAAVAHSRELLSVLNTLGMQRFYKMPYLLEHVTERLFAALHLANEAMARPRANATETYVVHERAEISELAENMISLIQRCCTGATHLSPLLERVKGWHAHLSGDANSASYHLNRSLLEARRWQLGNQETRTIEVMQSLQVQVMGSRECSHMKVKAALASIFGNGGCKGTSRSALSANPAEADAASGIAAV